MSDPYLFQTATPRLGLPLLFAGQAQKEVFVNEALSLADALLHGAIEGVGATPPATPADGLCWLVAAAPTGDWAGHEGEIACRQGGNWLFVTPRDGMRLLNRATGQDIRYSSGWHSPSAPTAPTGGTVIDIEARAGLEQLLSALVEAGVLS